MIRNLEGEDSALITILRSQKQNSSLNKDRYQIGNQEIHIRDKNSKYPSANMTAQDRSVKNSNCMIKAKALISSLRTLSNDCLWGFI